MGSGRLCGPRGGKESLAVARQTLKEEVCVCVSVCVMGAREREREIE